MIKLDVKQLTLSPAKIVVNFIEDSHEKNDNIKCPIKCEYEAKSVDTLVMHIKIKLKLIFGSSFPSRGWTLSHRSS